MIAPAVQVPSSAPCGAKTSVKVALMGEQQPMHQAIEVDLTGEEDSVYSSGLGSDTTSLATAARSHVFENGRRFHGYKDGKYAMPNDEKEQDRMDLEHHTRLLALKGELIMAPVKDQNPQRILDLGTGTGIWCIDVGDLYPAAEVIGVDLSPIQPTWVPPNVRFEVDDFEEPWTWPDNYFDYIHLSAMAGFVYNWPRLIERAFKALKPGGYIELQDRDAPFSCDDGSLPANSYLRRWIDLTEEAAGKNGRVWLDVPNLFRRELKEKGFDALSEQSVLVPIGRWAKERSLKELGVFNRQMLLDGAEAYTIANFTRTLEWEMDDVMDFVENVKREMKDPKIHTYEKLVCMYGRKPKNT